MHYPVKTLPLLAASLLAAAPASFAQVYVVHRGDNAVYVAPDPSAPVFTPFVSLPGQGRGVAASETGVFAASNGQQLRRFTSAGALGGVAADATALSNAKLAYNPDADVLYANGNNATFLYESAFGDGAVGVQLAQFWGAGDLDYVRIDGVPYLFAAGTGGSSIRRYTLAEDGRSVAATTTGSTLITAGGIRSAALGFDNRGRGVAVFGTDKDFPTTSAGVGIYFFTPGASSILPENLVLKLPIDGSLAPSETSPGHSQIHDVAFDPATVTDEGGVIWLVTANTNRVYRYTVDWTGEGSVAFLDSFTVGTANDNAFTNLFQVAFLPPPPVPESGFASWLAARDLPADADPASDADGDGLSLLLEYALGGEPDSDSSALLPSPVVADASPDPAVLSLAFTRVDDPSLTYTVLASSDLSAWDPIWSSTGAENTAGPVVVLDELPLAENPRRFLRLSVSQN